MIDRALQDEFHENDQNEAVPGAGGFNNSVAEQQDYVFIISNFKSKYPVLQLDAQLISDLRPGSCYRFGNLRLWRICFCWTAGLVKTII
ncbi:unnamed protein product [Lupinus luteus]|uniref:Uncharacterized protein n=1 Tax=Lupinus luteus TaxID=3873 RepID=A0AAV1YGP7_LUPLU